MRPLVFLLAIICILTIAWFGFAGGPARIRRTTVQPRTGRRIIRRRTRIVKQTPDVVVEERRIVE